MAKPAGKPKQPWEFEAEIAALLLILALGLGATYAPAWDKKPLDKASCLVLEQHLKNQGQAVQVISGELRVEAERLKAFLVVKCGEGLVRDITLDLGELKSWEGITWGAR